MFRLKLVAVTALAVLSLLVAPLLVGELTSPALAIDAKEQVCKGIGSASGEGGGCTNGGGPSVGRIVKTVVNILSIIAGVVAVIMIIVAGLKYITSSGDASNVSSAKNTLLYAIIGLIIVALAQVIVRFVLNRIE
jgi:hypothetical protein